MENEKKELYYLKEIKQWGDLYKFYIEQFTDNETEWVFRGDNPDPKNKDASNIPNGAFKSRLERAFDTYEIKDEEKRIKIEQKLIREFRRKAPIHTNYRQENWLECLGLMQHYEAPTRMLDWTYSFFAGVYFAINTAKKGNCVIWALDSKWLATKCDAFEKNFIDRFKGEKKNKLQKLREDGRGHFENLLIHHLLKEEKEPMVYAVNPYYLNERLSIQRGVLICPSRIDITWGKNLESMLKKENGGKCHLWRIRIEWKKVEVQKEFLRRLYDMNINQASLFPDLDGLAKSLRTRVAMPETLGIFE